MFRRILLLGSLVFSTFMVRPDFHDVPQSVDPVATWQRLLSAKGGADKLRTIRAFAISIQTKTPDGWTRPDVIADGQEEFVVLMPDRVWRASDFRPGTMGLTLEVWNRAKRTNWIIHDESPAIDAGWNSDYEDDMDSWSEELQLVYFGETAMLHPQPVAATRTGGTIDLMVRTPHFASVTYTLEQGTYLPTRIVMTPLLRMTGGRDRPARFSVSYVISAHQSVDDLTVPRVVANHGTASVSINPNVQLSLFESAPKTRKPADWRNYLIR